MAGRQRHPEDRAGPARLRPRGAQTGHERRIEQRVDRLTHGARWRDAVQPLQRGVPTDHPVVEADHDEAIVQRRDDVLAELAEPVQFVGLDAQLLVEAPVLEGRGHLPGDGRQQRHVLARERLAALLAAEQHHRDGAVLRHAGHEVVHAALAPRLHFLDRESASRQRVVERHR